VASVRHKHSLQKPWYRRSLHVVPLVAGALALIVASMTMALNDPEPVSSSASAKPAAGSSAKVPDASDLASSTSRDDVRPPLPAEDLQDVTGTKYAIADLDLHAGPEVKSPVLAEIKKGTKLFVTGKTEGALAEVVHKGASRWVTANYVKSEKELEDAKAKAKAKAEADKPLGGAPCSSGSTMEAGLQPDTIRVHRAVCAQFPEITSYLGLGGGGEHATGRAVDIMLGSNTGSGDAIAAFAMKHASELGVSEVIYRQRIWTVQRSGEGWRSMPDRGSPTANHMDHVHVTTYGSSGTS
jgi:hypothetical protein